MTTRCETPHPDLPGVVCEMDPHPFGAHVCVSISSVKPWPGEPVPDTQKKQSNKARAADLVNRTPTEERTGPPTGAMPRERLDGIRRVTSNTPQDWAEAFDRYVENIERGARFHVYDVLAVVGQPEGVHPSAIGARMRRASSKGLVVKVGHARRDTHGDVVTLWERV